MDSPPLLIPLINIRTIKGGWHGAPLRLQNFSRSNKQKVRFPLTLNKTFCPIPPPLTHPQLKHPHNIIILFSSPSSVFHTNFMPELKSNKCSTLTAIELRPLFHFPETVQVFSNPTPITQSSKNQPPLALSSTNTLHALYYANSLAKRLRRSSQTLGVTQGNLELSSLFQTQETKR